MNPANIYNKCYLGLIWIFQTVVQKVAKHFKKRKPPVPWGGFRGINAVTESDVWLDAVRQKYKQNPALQTPTQKYFNKQRAFFLVLKGNQFHYVVGV